MVALELRDFEEECLLRGAVKLANGFANDSFDGQIRISASSPLSLHSSQAELRV